MRLCSHQRGAALTKLPADGYLNTLPIERSMKLSGILLLISLVAAGLVACSKDSNDAPASGSNPDLARGRAVFVANCVACHNNDPSKDGPIGPAIKGSSRELIESRVLSTSYPPNYKPKRPTKVMPQFPYLKEDIPYLAAYLK
jgi:mono/diheme cytochrome c family protein